MTAKEAIEILTVTFSDTWYSQLKEAVHKAIEVLEDTLPKKPILEVSDRITVFKCPRCHGVVAFKVDGVFFPSALLSIKSDNFCRCEQEIDWSDEQ